MKEITMKTHKRRPLFTALFAALFLLAGCTNPLNRGGADSPDDSPASGRGIARISLAATQARTLLPASDVLADLYYALRFTAGNKPELTPAPVHSLRADVELEPGTWTLEVKGYASNEEAVDPVGDPMVSGSAELTVKSGNISPVSVSLSAKAETGSGTLDYNIVFPGEAQSARLVLTPLSGAAVIEVDLLVDAETDLRGLRKAGTQNLAAGYYRLGLEVSLPAGESPFPRTARKTAIIHIYNGFATSSAETFGPDNFYDMPTFATVENLSAWLAAAPRNTPETPYQIFLRDLDVQTAFAASDGDPLGKLYAALNGKYIALDLSGCTGTSIGASTESHVNRRGNKDGIVSLVLPETLKTIGDFTFYGCGSLVSLNWPSTEAGAEIGGYAFSWCHSLESVVLPEGLQYIRNGAFENCRSLATVELPAGLTNLGRSFVGCPNLVSVYLAPGIDASFAISGGAFADSRNLSFYTDPADTVFRTLLSGKLLAKNTTVMFASPGVAGELSLPSNITEIAPSVFSNNANLTRVILPAELQTIGYGAFQNCAALQSLSWPSTAANPTLGSNAFSRCTALTSIDLPSALTSIESSTFSGCGALTAITLPSSLERIDGGAFESAGLATLTLPATVETIGEYAFGNCAALQSVSWLSTAANPTLGSNAFMRCTALTSIDLPSALTSIESDTFSGCGALTAITLPSSLASIANNAFANTGLATLSLPAAVRDIGNTAFQNCRDLRWVKWPASPGGANLGGTGRSSTVFGNCILLEKVELPDNLATISGFSFNGCAALQVVVLRSETPPTLAATNSFPVFTNNNLRFYVPDTTALAAYKAADNWKSDEYIDKILATTQTVNPGAW
jgi:hypothetical protein